MTGHIAMERFRFAALTDGYFNHTLRWRKQADRTDRIRCEDMAHAPVDTLSFLRDGLGLDTAAITRLLACAETRTRRDGRLLWRRQERNHLNYQAPRHVEFFPRYRAAKAAAPGYDAASLRQEDTP